MYLCETFEFGGKSTDRYEKKLWSKINYIYTILINLTILINNNAVGWIDFLYTMKLKCPYKKVAYVFLDFLVSVSPLVRNLVLNCLKLIYTNLTK